MRPLRLLAIAGLVAFTALAIAACSAGATPAWTYAPAPPATPTPSPAASASAAPSAAASASVAASPAASGGATAGTTLDLTAQNIQFQETTLQAPAGQAFQIQFHNADAGVPHNVAIEDASGTVLFKGDIFSGVDTKVYDVPALPAGTYKFVCQVHPNMVGTLTVGP